MEIIKTPLEGLLVINPRVFGDDRGYFFESWSKQSFAKVGLDLDFVQDNQSLSSKGVLRGLHFQSPPYAQGKLVRVIKGAVLDVALDIRKDSPTYGQYFSVELSEENKTIVWIPPGFAHGFVTIEDNTIFTYKCTEVYNKESEGALLWNDKDLNINWEVNDPLVSEKDLGAGTFKGFVSKF
ncbi:MAG TPA: dTDP-4-dehydrorhamnose 3,5-epimerase [Flavobacteriales bacterium]|jgi:dTDP-4-dehydrorhamnose 3,5-epimerase|nr:dTDP-4-dehydrorhamnose 3,5-epimerase [Flavobacteriales bacterium]HIK63146.1 dTDP-4-dehydrorhamnose 3,5-epimerase [Flavobacteriales bacterium]